MQKRVIITILSAFMLALLICSAGCLNSDQIVGSWVTKNGVYAVFDNDGSGCFSAGEDVNHAPKIPFNWESVKANQNYKIILTPDAEEEAILYASQGILMINGIEYRRS